MTDPAVLDQPASTAGQPYDNTPQPSGESSTSNIELSEVETLRIENERLKRELAAHEEHRRRTDEINARIKAAAMHVDNAKAEYLSAKKNHKDTLEELRAFTSGDVQVKVEFEKPDDGKQSPGQASKPRPSSSKRRAVAATYGIWQHGLTRDGLDKVDVSKLRPIEPEFKKRKVQAVEVLGALFVPLEQEILADGSGFFDLWPLVDQSEWNARLANQYAHMISDLTDEAPDITAKRRAGGDLCGHMVKVGRKRLVVGPDAEVIRLVYLADGMKPGDACEASALMDEAANAAGAKVLSFPTKELANRMVQRLAEYPPVHAGHHEGLVVSLANDLGVDPSEIVAAAKSDTFRFDVVQIDAGALGSQEAIRLLANDGPSDAVTDEEIEEDDIDDEDDEAFA